MLRFYSKQLLSTRRPIFTLKNSIAQKAKYEVKHRPKEINSVTLMGTIEHEVHTFRGGSIKIYLKTLNKDASYCVHTVVIANKNLINIVRGKLAVGQRIYVGGKLQTQNENIENILYQDVSILANEMFLLESNPKIDDEGPPKPVQSDENSVEMFAFVGTEVRKEQNVASFCLMTHFIRHKDETEESEAREYHKVVIYNDPTLIGMGHCLQKFDRVYLRGQINYINKKYPNEKILPNGYIQPSNLIILKKFE